LSKPYEVHRDNRAIVAFNEAQGILELRWLPDSVDMTDDDFKSAMLRYAQSAGKYRPRYLLVDVTEFRFTPGADVASWREEEVIPRYNAAGVEKMAFLLPEGSEIPGPPQPEPPGNFPTGYFNERTGVFAWFGE
jgi:hypothetical protein